MRAGLGSLLQTKVNFKGMNIPISGLINLAKPFMGKFSPKVKEITGVSVDELLGELNGTPHNICSDRPSGDIHNKYKNL